MDEMRIKSSALRYILSLFVKKKIKEKIDQEVDVTIYELDAVSDDKTKMTQAHISIDLKMSTEDFHNLLKQFA